MSGRQVISPQDHEGDDPCREKDSSRTPNSASQMIDQRIGELGDWRGSVLKRMRELIHEADPEVVEEWK